jgi:glyoxylase-like metal-dependent hydrolase (beta-lactamase superfamily II)
MLIDTGLAALRDETLAALSAEIDPAQLRWIFVSHFDGDHTGNLAAVLALAPHARVVTGLLGRAKMELAGGFPLDRIEVIAAGDTLDVAGRCIRVVRPPYYDAPETLGFHDAASGTLFVVDAFGAVLPATADDDADLDDATLDRGLATWSALDAPWLTSLDRQRFAATLAALDALAPRHVLSAHLPPSRDVRALTSRVMRLREASDALDRAA